jgi:hypothetical protein
VHNVKAYWRVEVYLQSVTQALDGGGWSVSRRGCCRLGKEPRLPINSSIVTLQSNFGHFLNERRVFCPCLQSDHDFLVLQLVTQSLYRPRYPGLRRNLTLKKTGRNFKTRRFHTWMLALFTVIIPNINRYKSPTLSKPRARINITYSKCLKQNILIYVGQLIGVL